MNHAHHHPIAHFAAKIGRLPNALIYLLLAILGAVAVYELSPGMLVLLTIGVGMVLALVTRIQHPLQPAVGAAGRPRGLILGDGGSFPGETTARRSPSSVAARVAVVDGGSFEKHLY